jgi:hypothetical protein
MTSVKALESKMQELERKIRTKIEQKTGFATDTNQIRYFNKALQFYDTQNNGLLSFPDFMTYVLQRLNFIGCNDELEAMFYRLDENLTGFVNYHDLVNQIYGKGMFPYLSIDALETMERLRNSLIAKENESVIRFVLNLKSIPSLNLDGTAPLSSVVDYISGCIGRGLSTERLSFLLKQFIFSPGGTKVDISAFLRSFKVSLSL